MERDNQSDYQDLNILEKVEFLGISISEAKDWLDYLLEDDSGAGEKHVQPMANFSRGRVHGLRQRAEAMQGMCIAEAA